MSVHQQWRSALFASGTMLLAAAPAFAQEADASAPGQLEEVVVGRTKELIAQVTGEPARPARLVRWDDKGKREVES